MQPSAEGAAVLFVNGHGQILLRLRDSKPSLPFPNRWDLIGGAVEPGETPEQAAVREVAEELAIVLHGYRPFGDYQGDVLNHVFVARLDTPVEDLELAEGQGLRWVAPRDALTLDLVPWMKDVMAAAIASGLQAP